MYSALLNGLGGLPFAGMIGIYRASMSIVGVEAKNTIIQDRVGVLSPGAVFSVHRCRKGSDF